MDPDALGQLLQAAGVKLGPGLIGIGAQGIYWQVNDLAGLKDSFSFSEKRHERAFLSGLITIFYHTFL